MQNIGLVEIFGHSKRHIFYDKLPVRVIRDDVVESYEMIEKNLDASRFFWSDCRSYLQLFSLLTIDTNINQVIYRLANNLIKIK